jgi:hypothetical protein
VLYEIVTPSGAILATLPGVGPSPQLAALRCLYDLSGCVSVPVTLWRITYGGSVTALPVCSLFRGAIAPLPEC